MQLSKSRGLQKCPQCRYLLLENESTCPYCGEQLRAPLWKRVGAWILLILIIYGLVKCHIRMIGGLEGL